MAPKIHNKEWRAHRERIMALRAMCERRGHYSTNVLVDRVLRIPRNTLFIGPWAINLRSVMKRKVTVETAAFMLEPPHDTLMLSDDGLVFVKNDRTNKYNEVTQRIQRDTFRQINACTANWMRILTHQHQS